MMHASEQISLFCRLNINLKRDLPIRSSEMGLLIYLVKTQEEKTTNGVAQFFNFTKATATNMVTSLTSKGYIHKLKSEKDKRSVVLVPTQKAISLVEETYNHYFDAMNILERKMGQESFDQMITLLEQVNTILLEEKNKDKNLGYRRIGKCWKICC